MKRFKFNLQKALDLKTYRERDAEIELGRAIGELSVIEQRIAVLANERAQAASERFASGHGAEEIVRYDLYIRRLDKTRDQLLEEEAKAELRVEKAREEYIEASRERKVLDKIKERRQKEYRRELFAEETKTLDDISNGAYAREMLQSIE
jgi:flagellar FliJ protein